MKISRSIKKTIAIFQGSIFALFLMAGVILPSNNVFALPPIVNKSFTSNVIDAPGTSILTIELINPNFAPAVLTAPLVDTFPANVVANSAAITTCVDGTVSNTATSVTLAAGAIIPGSGSCTVSISVGTAIQGNYLNTLAAGALVTTQGTNASPASATLTVNLEQPLTVGKAFSNISVNPGEVSDLIITISNNNEISPATSVSLTEVLPAGLLSLNNGSSSCGGVLTGTPSAINFSGGTIPADGACVLTVPVLAQSAGNYINTVASGAATALVVTALVTNADPATATLSVIPPEQRPIVIKAFNPSTVVCGTSELTITLVNPLTTTLAITSFVDRLPPGLFVVGNATTTCPGSAVTVRHDSVISLLGGVIPASGSCVIRAQVTARCRGDFVNRIFPGALQTPIGPNVNTASASVNFCCDNGSIDACINDVNTDDESETSLYDGR